MSKQALISVSDKRGVVDFARALHQLGYRILSTGGTARLVAEAAIPVTEVADYTGFPEMLDGRVKTLNPRIHGPCGGHIRMFSLESPALRNPAGQR